MTSRNFILQMFGESPIRPLQKHMEKAYECAELLLPFFHLVLAEDWDHAEIKQKEIAKMENEADQLKKDLRVQLPKSVFLPMPRTDLLQMITLQDQLPNKAKDIAGLVLGRRMRFPTTLTTQYMEFLQRSLEAAKQARQAIDELDELLETGFRGSEVKIIENMIIELDSIENATDKMQVHLRANLYKLEKDWPAVDVMFLYKILEWTGDLADIAHNVGEQMCLLLVR